MLWTESSLSRKLANGQLEMTGSLEKEQQSRN